MSKDFNDDEAIIVNYASKNYPKMFRQPGGALKYPFITPGASQYSDQLWDWDSWLTDVALHQIAHLTRQPTDKLEKYGRGCVQNFLNYADIDGWLPICIDRQFSITKDKPQHINDHSMHKPVLAQHTAFLVKETGKVEWLRESFYYLQEFTNNYLNYRRDRITGLCYWVNDESIGVDNDPATFFRRDRSSASILLNCFMVKELEALSFIANKLSLKDTAAEYHQDQVNLINAIQKYCWDPLDGLFYSCDLDLRPLNRHATIHFGQPRTWDCVLQRFHSWSSLLPMWAGIATRKQAAQMVKALRDPRQFNAPYGVFTLSPLEKMYNTKATGNPSNWLGPIWGLSNYFCFAGLVRYGYQDDAKKIAKKTIHMFANDIRKSGDLHENYDPHSGLPLLNKGFQNWNLLVTSMIAWLNGKPLITTF